MSEKESFVRILPIEDAALLARLNETYGTRARFGFLYVEKREIKSTALYQMQKPHLQVLNISSHDPEIFKALANAILEAGVREGMTDVRFAPAVEDELLALLTLGEEVRERTYFLPKS